MSPVPAHPKIYHITHVDNLARIVEDGGLWSDAQMVARGGPSAAIGMSNIKRRRVEELAVSCCPGTQVGDYVPFYHCPRSVMLYVIYKANPPGLTYRGGQGPIVHLEADLLQVVRWAEAHGVPWAISLANAGARATEFRATVEQLDELDWAAITATDFSAPDVRERKQAEFLLHRRSPFDLVERIGVHSAPIQKAATQAISDSPYRPAIEVQRDWYF